ncbi:hypothetical protein SLH46_15175 [Draconibacterium sp. IB214405]|uniref:hypothetical protein n=1 Tax=Draconibacterium sp. IB214405 TaxID=3097352 RepID=UPI002A10A4AD|nr:hypothetical protein [Draconibacterium sp. IB214405]MDX8340540.1 hypothetical protein [Draconibacterium sp. IB214405]
MNYSVYRKVLLMVSELHVRGYQLLRIAPGMAPSGLHWRCSITPATNILKSNGALQYSFEDGVSVNYTSGLENHYFGWSDAGYITPSKMAKLFIQRFPRIAEAGKGSDWSYAGWYVEMLHLTYPDGFPIAYEDSYSANRFRDGLRMVGGKSDLTIPHPPPGLAEEVC